MFRLLILVAALFGIVEATGKPNCNIYERNLVWILEDCICRPIQNPCLMESENALRCKSGKTPFVPVTEQLCKFFIPKICRKGLPVIGKFPKPPACGCKGKPGTITERRFKNICELRKYSALNNEAYTSYSFSLIPPFKKCH